MQRGMLVDDITYARTTVRSLDCGLAAPRYIFTAILIIRARPVPKREYRMLAVIYQVGFINVAFATLYELLSFGYAFSEIINDYRMTHIGLNGTKLAIFAITTIYLARKARTWVPTDGSNQRDVMAACLTLTGIVWLLTGSALTIDILYGVYGSAYEELFKNRPGQLVDILVRPIAVTLLGLVMVSCRDFLANLCRGSALTKFRQAETPSGN